MLGDAIKSEFPIFDHHRDLVFLDSAASAQKPAVVLEAMDKFYRTSYTNIHRGVYQLAEAATAGYEKARATGAKFIQAADASEVVFTRGTTSSLNGVAQMLAPGLHPGDEILLTELEHHANLIPWQQVALKTGAGLKFIPVTGEGRLDTSQLGTLISSQTKVVAFSAMSNVLGSMTEVKAIVTAASRASALTVVDAAQYAPHAEIDVQAWGADFVVFSGHKIFGPTGIGVLYGRRELLARLEPFEFGGNMIREVSLTSATWADAPAKFEAGTPPIVEAVGLAVALEFVTKIGWNQITSHEQELMAYALVSLAKLPGVNLIGPKETANRGPVFSFTVQGVHPHDLASILDSVGIAVRAGHHCALPLHKKFGLPATTRASFSIYNTREDVNALVAGIKRAQQMLL